MSDPLEMLRPARAGPVPDIGAIKARARSIERRRRIGAAAGASVVAVVAVIGVLVAAGPVRQRSAERALPTLLGASVPGAVPSTGSQTLLRGAGSEADATATQGPHVEAAQEPKAMMSGAASDSGAQLEATVSVAQRVHGADLTLKVCNTTHHAVSRSFNTSQRYDFEVRRARDLVWRWSDGRVFADVVGSQAWGPGECKRWKQTWDGTRSDGSPAQPGTYEAVGVLKSSPEQRTAPKGFCLDIC